jgi:uncharacterized protein
MSSAPADLVNAVELAGRSATLERRLNLRHLPRLVEAGALEGTRASAELAFGRIEGRTTVEVQVSGELVLTCQRCLRPCTCTVNETASLVVMASDADEVPGGFEPLLGDAERLSVTELIEEQLLLGLPLVPKHATTALCGAAPAAIAISATEAAADETQRPFANLRKLLDEGSG